MNVSSSVKKEHGGKIYLFILHALYIVFRLHALYAQVLHFQDAELFVVPIKLVVAGTSLKKLYTLIVWSF